MSLGAFKSYFSGSAVACSRRECVHSQPRELSSSHTLPRGWTHRVSAETIGQTLSAGRRGDWNGHSQGPDSLALGRGGGGQLGPQHLRGQATARYRLLRGTGSPALGRVGIQGARPGEPRRLLSAPLPHSQSQRARVPWHPGSRSRTKMNFTAPWVWSGSRRSSRRLGLEEGRSQAAATGRKTLNVRGRPSRGRGPLRLDCSARRG